MSATISFEWMDLLKRTHPQRQVIYPVHEIKRNKVLKVIHFQYIPTKRNFKSLSFSIVSNFTLLTGNFHMIILKRIKNFICESGQIIQEIQGSEMRKSSV